MNRVIVVSPHPDDDAIGCGGTIRRHVLAGDDVSVIVLTSGEKGGHGRTEAETLRLREQEARDAGAILGLKTIEFWHQPDGALAVTPDLIARLRERIGAGSNTMVYVTHDREMHPDHVAAAALVGEALAPLAPAERPDVLMYEVWTPTQQLDHIEDITAHIEIKRRAIQAHATQCEVMAFDDAAIGLARYRGEMHCWPEGEYAEVFTRMPFEKTP